MKKLLASVILSLIIALSLASCRIQSVDDYYSSSTENNGTAQAYASISIDCKTILDNYDKLDENLKDEKYVPKDGIILEKTEYPIEQGDTVFSILQKAVKDKRIQMEFQGDDQNSLGTVYVQGINYLYEFSCGELSGWFYNVNGEFGNASAADCKIKNGDYVRWQYTCSLGEDIGANITE